MLEVFCGKGVIPSPETIYPRYCICFFQEITFDFFEL